jgi:hypothetical protein
MVNSTALKTISVKICEDTFTLQGVKLHHNLKPSTKNKKESKNF